MPVTVNKFDSIEEIEKFSQETDLPLFLEFCASDNYDKEEEDDLTKNGCFSEMAR